MGQDAPTPVEPTASTSEAPKTKFTPKKAGMPKLLPLIAIGVVALIAIVVVITSIGGSDTPQVFFIQDDEMMFTDLEMEEPMEISSRLYSDGLSSIYDVYMLSSAVNGLTSITADQSIIVFPDRIDDDGYTLYYRSLEDAEASSEKIDSNIVTYAMDPDGAYIIYLTEDNDLYYYDFTDKDRIDSDVSDFDFNDDHTQIFYSVGDVSITSSSSTTTSSSSDSAPTMDLYLCDVGGESEKLASGVTSMVKYNSDHSVFVWLKDDAMYRWDVETGDSEKIVSDVGSIVKAVSVDTIYYSKTEDVSLSFSSFINDDTKTSDTSATNPYDSYDVAEPEYPNSSDYAYYDEYYDAWDAYYDEYDIWYAGFQAAYNQYRIAEARNSLRDYVASATYDTTETTLYCYQDGESSEVLSGYKYRHSNSSDGTTFLVQTSDLDTPTTYKMSDLINEDTYYYYYSASDYIDFIYYEFSATSSYYIVQNGVAEEFEEDLTSVVFNEDGSSVLYFDNVDEDTYSEGDLYQATVTDGALSAATLVDYDVFVSGLKFTDEGSVLYYKEVNDSQSTGDLYMDGTRISYDVDLYSTNTSLKEGVIYYTVDSNDKGEYTLYAYSNGESVKIDDDVSTYGVRDNDDALYYYTDYESDRYSGTLYRYADGTSTKIDDDVYTYTILSDGRILYLYDYSTNSYEGILCQYDEEGRIRLENDVQMLLNISDEFIKSVSYLF